MQPVHDVRPEIFEHKNINVAQLFHSLGDLKYETNIAAFIQSNKQLEILHIDCNELQINCIALAFIDSVCHLREVRIHNASLPFLLDQRNYNEMNSRKISHLEFHNLRFNVLKFQNSEWLHECMNSVMNDSALCLFFLHIEALDNHVEETLLGF